MQERIANLVLFVLAIVFVVFINPNFTSDGDGTVTSPRLLPAICGVIVAVFTGGLLIQSFLSKGLSEPEDGAQLGEDTLITRFEIGIVAAVTVLLIASLLLLDWVGPLWASLVLISGTQLLTGERGPIALVLTPFFLISGAYLVFYKLLGTSVG